MKAMKLLTVTAALLLGALVVQVARRDRVQPGPRTFALWKHHPGNEKELKDLSTYVIRAIVTAVGDGEPVIVKVPGATNDVDIVRFRLVRLKPEQFVKPDIKLADGPTDIPILSPVSGDALVPIGPLSEDDPDYKEGERYELCLLEGRKTSAGAQTYFVVSPEGRYFIDPLNGNRLRPAEPQERGGFAQKYLNVEPAVFEQAIRDAK